MIDLDKVRLEEPLSFVVDPQDEHAKRNGICIKEISSDGKTERFHEFDCSSGVYRGYFDRDREGGKTIRSMTYTYKGSLKDGEPRYYREERKGLYRVGEKEVVSGRGLSQVEVDERGVAKLINKERLVPLEPPETALERLTHEAAEQGQTPAEKYGEVDANLQGEPDGLNPEDIERPPQRF